MEEGTCAAAFPANFLAEAPFSRRRLLAGCSCDDDDCRELPDGGDDDLRLLPGIGDDDDVPSSSGDDDGLVRMQYEEKRHVFQCSLGEGSINTISPILGWEMGGKKKHIFQRSLGEGKE